MAGECLVDPMSAGSALPGSASPVVIHFLTFISVPHTVQRNLFSPTDLLWHSLNTRTPFPFSLSWPSCLHVHVIFISNFSFI